MEHNREVHKDIDILIQTALEIGNHMQGKGFNGHSSEIIYAEGLGQKIIHHAISARYLSSGYQLGVGSAQFYPQFDFASMAILTRAAWETYLTLSYLFISGQSKDELRFRFLCWHLAGFFDRAGATPTEQKHIEMMEFEKSEIERITLQLSNLPIFQLLPKHNKSKILSGEWKNKSWRELAVDAGFDEHFFKKHYRYLCGYSHSSRLSVIQIQQTKDPQRQKEMADSFLTILQPVLAKFMFDYITLIPELKTVATKHKGYEHILLWKGVGENMK